MYESPMTVEYTLDEVNVIGRPVLHASPDYCVPVGPPAVPVGLPAVPVGLPAVPVGLPLCLLARLLCLLAFLLCLLARSLARLLACIPGTGPCCSACQRSGQPQEAEPVSPRSH